MHLLNYFVLRACFSLVPRPFEGREKGPDTHCMHIFKFASIFSPDTFATMWLSGYGQIMYNLHTMYSLKRQIYVQDLFMLIM